MKLCLATAVRKADRVPCCCQDLPELHQDCAGTRQHSSVHSLRHIQNLYRSSDSRDFRDRQPMQQTCICCCSRTGNYPDRQVLFLYGSRLCSCVQRKNIYSSYHLTSPTHPSRQFRRLLMLLESAQLPLLPVSWRSLPDRYHCQRCLSGLRIHL